MSMLKSLKREHKEFLAEQNIKPRNYLLKYEDAWSYVFYNTWTSKQLEFRR